jgi:sporulation protein YlmC with PRC-barrel domain
MVVAAQHELVGCSAFSRDGTKLGKIKDVIVDDGTSSEYVVVSRFLSRDLVIPADLVEGRGRIVIPFSSSYLDMAPALSAKGRLSSEDRSRLEHFYRARAQ